MADGARMAGLRLTLAPGWKTYWRVPGEGGIAPVFDWSGSDGLARAEPLWPVPERFEQAGMESFGYQGEVVLPVRVTPAAEDRPARLSLDLALGVCREICLPVRLTLAEAADSPEGVPAIRAALARLPRGADVAGLAAARCAVRPIADGLALTLRLPAPEGPVHAAVVEPGRADVWASPVKIAAGEGRLTLTSDLVPPGGAPYEADLSALRLTVFAGAGAITWAGCAAADG